jgi:putative DNA primase/helicase
LIQIRAGELPEVVDDAEQYLIDSGAEIFQHGTRLVRVGRWDAETRGQVERPHGAGVLIDISPDWLTDTLTRTIRWERYDARKDAMKKVDCPGKVSTTLLARVGSWSFPGLVGFCDSPTLDRQGRVVSAPGYDPESGLYLAHPPAIAPMVTTDRYLAERGAEILSEAVSTFPFVSEGDKSACLALLMTVILRRILPSAPLGGVTANTPGTGKSKLVDVIATIATGRSASVVAIGSTPEELEKRVDSILLKGDTLATFDNVDRAIKSDILCQVATQSSKSIRVMGLSKIVEAPTNVAIMLTGNNLTLVGDLVRRCLVIHLDAQTERPELRVFQRDALEYVRERRGALIHAALSISKSYIDAGCPDVGSTPFGSFEQWDRMIRRALIWAGMPDPLKPAEAMREQDHELVGMRDFMRCWVATHPEPITAADLLELIKTRVPMMGEGWAWKHPELQDAAVQVFGDLNRCTGRDVAYRLRAMHGRLFDGRRVTKTPKAKIGVRWYVEVVP